MALRNEGILKIERGSNRCGGGYEPVVRQTTEWMTTCSPEMTVQIEQCKNLHANVFGTI